MHAWILTFICRIVVTAKILCLGIFFSGANVKILTFCPITINSGNIVIWLTLSFVVSESGYDTVISLLESAANEPPVFFSSRSGGEGDIIGLGGMTPGDTRFFCHWFLRGFWGYRWLAIVFKLNNFVHYFEDLVFQQSYILDLGHVIGNINNEGRLRISITLVTWNFLKAKSGRF